MKFPCKQCEFQAFKLLCLIKNYLLTHIRSINYPLSLLNEKGHLLTHVKSVHEGVKFLSSQCEYKATLKMALSIHMTHEIYP